MSQRSIKSPRIIFNQSLLDQAEEEPQPQDKQSPQYNYAIPDYTTTLPKTIRNKKITKVCCIRISDQWRMKTQVCIASIILFIFSFLSMLGVSAFNIQAVDAELQRSSKDLFNSQVRNSMESINKQFQNLVLSQLDAIHHDLVVLQRIYNYNENRRNPFSNSDSTLDAPFTKSLRPNFMNNYTDKFAKSFLCYGCLNSTYLNKSSLLRERTFDQNAVRQMNQFYPLLRNTNKTVLTQYVYGVFNREDQLFFQYGCRYFGPDHYSAHSRPWYLEMVANDKLQRQQSRLLRGYQLSNPYLDYNANSTTLTITKSILGLNGQFKGVYASDIDIGKFFRLFDLNFTNKKIFMVDSQGILLISKYMEDQRTLSNQTFIWFYNSSITGFDSEVWESIKTMNNQSSKVLQSSNCSSIAKGSILCRWNSLDNETVVINSFYIQSLEYYIIIYQAEDKFLHQIEDQLQGFHQRMLDEIINFFTILIISFTVLMGLISCIIHQIFQPLQNITRFSEQIVFKHQIQLKEKKRVSIEQVYSSGVFSPLTAAFQNTVARITTMNRSKNQYCQLLENIRYPPRNRLRRLNTDLIEQLEDFNLNCPPSMHRILRLDQHVIPNEQTQPELLNSQRQQKQINIEKEQQLELLKHSIQHGKYSTSKLIQFIADMIRSHNKY